jgi:hypothetical protein
VLRSIRCWSSSPPISPGSASQGVSVARYNLGQEPQAFAANPAVVKEMEAGMERLPIIAIDGQIMTTGLYPSRTQLAQKARSGAERRRRSAEKILLFAEIRLLLKRPRR